MSLIVFVDSGLSAEREAELLVPDFYDLIKSQIYSDPDECRRAIAKILRGARGELVEVIAGLINESRKAPRTSDK